MQLFYSIPHRPSYKPYHGRWSWRGRTLEAHASALKWRASLIYHGASPSVLAMQSRAGWSRFLSIRRRPHQRRPRRSQRSSAARESRQVINMRSILRREAPPRVLSRLTTLRPLTGACCLPLQYTHRCKSAGLHVSYLSTLVKGGPVPLDEPTTRLLEPIRSHDGTPSESGRSPPQLYKRPPSHTPCIHRLRNGASVHPSPSHCSLSPPPPIASKQAIAPSPA